MKRGHGLGEFSNKPERGTEWGYEEWVEIQSLFEWTLLTECAVPLGLFCGYPTQRKSLRKLLRTFYSRRSIICLILNGGGGFLGLS